MTLWCTSSFIFDSRASPTRFPAETIRFQLDERPYLSGFEPGNGRLQLANGALVRPLACGGSNETVTLCLGAAIAPGDKALDVVEQFIDRSCPVLQNQQHLHFEF